MPDFGCRNWNLKSSHEICTTMKKISLLIFTTLSLSNIYAQKIQPKVILSTAVNDEKWQSNRQLADYAQGLKFHIPFVKQVEARLGFNGNALGDTIYGYIRNEDFYGVQVGFNGYKEIKQQKNLKQAQINVYQSENRLLEQEALKERYETLVSLRFTDLSLQERQKLDSLLSKKHDILRVMMERGIDIKVKDVIDTEGDKNTLQLNILDLGNNKRFHESKLQQFLDLKSDVELDWTDFISIEKIAQIIDNQKVIPSQFPNIDYRNARTQYALADVEYVNAQNRQILNMARVGFENPLYLDEQRPKKFNTFNNFSVRIGLTVPLLGNNNFKRSEALLKQRAAQNEAQWTRLQNHQSIDIQYLKLENLLKQCRFYQDKINQNLIVKMLANENLLAQVTPLELVDMQLTQQKLQVRFVEIVEEITSEYLKLMDLTGALSTKPLKNYLTNLMEGF